MKKFALAAILAASSFCASTPALAHQIGDWVLAPIPGQQGEYPGVITGRSGQWVTISFDGGRVLKVDVNRVHQFTWQRGTGIRCKWTDGKWYDATIRMIAPDGLTMNIRYDDDGQMQRTTTGKCHTR